MNRVSNSLKIGPQKCVSSINISIKNVSSPSSSTHRSSNNRSNSNNNNNNNNSSNSNSNSNLSSSNNEYHVNHSIHREITYTNSIPQKLNHVGSLYNNLSWRHPANNYHHYHHHHHQQRFRNYSGKRKKVHILQPALMSPNGTKTSSRDSRNNSQNVNRCNVVGMETLR